ncbi:hypothetical protein [Paenibacillus sp. 1P07SE]|uniref:hypothetical protein n=1 Tax=Paenibacillus sp. 1P07SE TaxID=3132209 RepID=UPI0039A5E010
MSKVVWLAAMLVLFMNVQPATACSPMPWSYEELAHASTAILYGEVAEAYQDGRQPRVKAIQYVGPGPAPKTVLFPATVSSRKTPDDDCPDFSTTFQQGQAYLFFMKTTGPEPELLYTEWITALQVTDDAVVVTIHGDEANVQSLLEAYATDNQQAVQTPDEAAPVWGEGKAFMPGVMIAAIVLALAGGVLLVVVRKRR